MNRRMIWTALSRTLFACGLMAWLVGCQEQSSQPGKVKPNDSALPTSQVPATPKSLLKGWPDPAAVLLLTGEMDGYLEPCGCSLTQSGGMTRRADLVRIISEEKRWPVAGLDVGNILKRHRTLDETKFPHILNALKDLRYEAIGLGIADLRLKPETLITLQPPGPEDPGVRFLSANVTFFDVPELGTPIRTRIFTVGKVKVGVTAVLAGSKIPEIAPQGAKSNTSASDPGKAIHAALDTFSKAKEPPDVLVLMSQGSVEEAKDFAKQFPQFAIILTAGGPEDPPDSPLTVGETLVIQPGHKGKYVGVVGIYPEEQGTKKFRFELVDLDSGRFKEVPAMYAHMRAYQAQLAEKNLAESNEFMIPHPSGFQFVGAAKCRDCHPAAYEIWEKSSHAHAYVSIEKGRPGKEADFVPRIHDPECLTCHNTGWQPQDFLRFDTGFINMARTPHLAGQQCENCHNPGSQHVDLETRWKQNANSVPDADLKAARAFVRQDLATAKKSGCISCHDGDNSPGFKFDDYWDQIKHSEKK